MLPSKIIRHLLGTCIGVLCLTSAAFTDFTLPWTSAGSAGTVDEADLGIVSLSSPYVTLTGAAPAGSTVDVRYNVVYLTGLQGFDRFLLRVRFLDNGNGARVIARLKEYDITNGNTLTLLTLDSNDFAGGAGYQIHEESSECWVHWFDSRDKVYFIELELQKSAAGGSAGVAAIQILGSLC